MNFIKYTCVFLMALVTFYTKGQVALYYTAPVGEFKEANYLIFNPDTSFARLTAFDATISKQNVSKTIQNYGERLVLFETDSFTIETDRALSLFFKPKNKGKEIYLNHVLSQNECWANGAIVYIHPTKSDKNVLGLHMANENGNTLQKPEAVVYCGEALLQINIEEQMANATGAPMRSFIQKMGEQVTVKEGRKVLEINVPAEAFRKLISLNFKLYNAKGIEVKDFLNMRSSESVVYINDLPKGKYKYIVETYQGVLVKKGEIQITKKK